MDFRERLQQATERGIQSRDERISAAAAQALSEEECKRRHSSYRLTLCDHIEECLRGLADNFPGFRLETIVDDSGWGTVASRDDVGLAKRRSDNFFSRLQMVVSPYNKYHVLEVSAKGTIRNKEIFTRSHFQRLDAFDMQRFRDLIEQWVVEYAELFAANG